MADLSSAAPAATQSIHREFLERSSPSWLINATSSRRAQLKAAPAQVPDWYSRASPAQQTALTDKYTASLTAQTALDKAFASLQDIDTFAEPLLIKALQAQFKVQLDVNKTLLQLRTRVEYLQPQATYGTFEVVRLPLLQAALHNFEESECKEGAFDASSGFVIETSGAEKFEAVSTSLTVAQFTGLCRSLDIGAQYQRYLKDFVQPKDAVADQVLRQKFSAARKADLAAAAEQALLTQDIGPDDYQMIASVINGENHPWMGKRQVWFRDLGLMHKRMTGCIAFVICEKYRYTNDLILYIPHDPHHPLKRVTYAQMRTIFKKRFTERETSAPDDGRPTAYQHFFSRFVRYGDLPTYFGELTTTTPAPGALVGLKVYSPFLIHFLRGISPFKTVEAASDPEPIKRLNPDPFLNPSTMNQKGRIGWEDNLDLWTYLFEQHRDKLLADALSHAVPTANVDARVRSEKFAKLFNIGFLALNVVSMFVPVLGEVMMVVMAGQLLYTTLEGSIEWAEGDRRAAKAHLVDVAENLAFLALLAGGAKVIGKLSAAKPEPLIEALDPVTLPNGEARLWKPDLQGYESPVNLPADAAPNTQGQFHHEGKTYIRQSGKVYEKTFDPTLNSWRIKHPTDPAAYEPPLSHNGAGAWRHTLERPLAWNRTTLMRRIGHKVDRFTDEQLLQIADISGTSDNALRKMHLDDAPPPAALADTLRLFRADADVAQVIEQVSSGQAVDGRYLYSLPLVTELPRWPVGRVLEVFEGPGLTGTLQRYGTERLFRGVKLKPPIRVSRTDVLSNKLPAQILDALDESEIVGLLGGEGARVRETRPQDFRKQLADYARSRQPALFDSLYKGTEAPDALVAKLQRMYPGLSEHAAQRVLADASGEQLGRFQTSGRVPLSMQEQARWYVRQDRLSRAYAGLHMENMAAADSKRLALHTLSKLPGWQDLVRLEIREDSISGRLLDSIGSQTAAHTKYLVKKGPHYQAFNERGEALNSLPRHGDNFYPSVMHALPDEARQALGIPHVAQSQDLRRAIIDYAAEHRVASAQIVEGAPARQSWFKPPRRISGKQIGYLASGRGEGISPSLVSRVRDVYPQMTDGQANGFIFKQMIDGKNDTQIFSLLNNRLREWQQLNATLSAWQLDEPASTVMRLFPIGSRQDVVRALKSSWQNAPLAELPGLDRLTLECDSPLPALDADFSHVRTLNISGPGMIEGHIDQLLGYFPEVQELTLSRAATSPSSVPAALEGLQALKRLKILSATQLASSELARLEAMTGLEALDLYSTRGYSIAEPLRALDVSRLSKLRSLKLSGAGHQDFPLGVLKLPELKRLDLKGSSVDQIPAQLFEPGSESVWSGLSMDWSRFTRERFKAAYDYVRSHPEHLMDQDEMVREYCSGVLDDGLGRTRNLTTSIRGPLNGVFFARWATAQAQFDAIEALSTEYAELSRILDSWLSLDVAGREFSSRSQINLALRKVWNEGLVQRYGIPLPSTLALPNVTVSELPILPATGFEHVTQVLLPNSRVPAPQMSGFIRSFSGLQRLDVSGCNLTELAFGEWPSLQHLNLGNNPLASLDVSGLSQLQALNLQGSTLPTWPKGAEQLPQLSWLNLRDSAITRLPESALAEDRVILNTDLAGAHLDDEAKAAVTLARQRVEQALGLSDGTLDRFERQPPGAVFPPTESGTGLAHQLLPLLAPNPGDGMLSPVQQLQRLHPALGTDGAAQWLERLRSEGLSDLQVGDRISAWEQTFETLTRRFNSWLFTRTFSLRQNRLVTSQSRRLAGEKMLSRWLDGVSNVVGDTGRELNFDGLILGELPELPVTFASIETLNLTGVQLSEASCGGFLRGFPNLHMLVLSSNPLRVIPEVVGSLSGLRRLELSAIDVSDAEGLYPTLMRLEQLQWLDISYCNLPTFRIDPTSRLHTLDLSDNSLTLWPGNALQATSLRRLDLSRNEIAEIPDEALEGVHDVLMAGVDLSDNYDLALDDLLRLQAYARRTGSDSALGISRDGLQELINGFDSPSSGDNGVDSDGEGVPDLAPAQPDETLDRAFTGDEYRDPWLHNLPPEEIAHNSELWRQLAAESGNEAFFNLLSLLRDTKDFRQVRAALRHRVWVVMEAAAGEAELRETLFRASDTHGTCADGRILTFAGLEAKVYVANVLSEINPTDRVGTGDALWDLSLKLFFRDQVELLASKHTAGRDAAEVRLKYLIGLRTRLRLPGVPETMIFDTPISGAPMQKAAKDIVDLVKTEVFYQDLISRDYWVGWLKEWYPEDFAALDERRGSRLETFMTHYPDPEAASYNAAKSDMEFDVESDQTVTHIALSKRLVTALNLTVPDWALSGTSANLAGPSTH